MSARLHSQAGFSLPEVLIAMTLMLVIMGATLTTLDQARTNQRLDERRTESQDNLRRGMDQLQRQLRNLATPASTVKSINRATSTDVIFQTADPQKRWVRYCIDPADPLVLTGKASLWYGISNVVSNTPPAATSCPGSGWSSDTSIGQAVVNARNGLNRPVFAFNWPKDASGNDITTDTSAITQVRTELWVDVSPGKAPPEQRLSSGVFLRNQNQAPVAAFTFAATGRVLNASGTTDFEGRRLNYHWYYGPSAATPPTGCAPADPAVPNAGANIKYLGFGTVQRLPATGITSPQTVTLCVVDPGDLQVTLTKTVTF
jgi:prepilin-type N-terminal cleavage/methylation domain-containing protein